VTDDTVRDLLKRSGISFVATVQRLGVATMSDIPVDNHTAVVVVDRVLHAPPAFAGLAGSPVTVQLDVGEPLPQVGDQLAFFADAVAFGETLAVTEVGRISIPEMTPHLGAMAAPGGERPVADLQASIEADEVSQHAADADAVVLGVVAKLEKMGSRSLSEHDADWWVATLQIDHVERGEVPGQTVTVAYANSLDVRWRDSPKPKASQSGLWLLHRSEGAVADIAPFYLPHADDYQPVQTLDAIRAGGGGS
jgi:hypothetical protein